MTYSMEALHGLNKTHIEKLEKCDRSLWRNIFDTPSSTPSESFYFETGEMPLHLIILSRQFMYYWTLLQKPEKVFLAQREFPVKVDWVSTVRQEMNNSYITVSDLEISKLSKNECKTILKNKLRDRCDSYLLELQIKNKKTKMLRLSPNMKEYLTTELLTVEEKKLLFKLKTRMIDIKCNFKNKYNDLTCIMCGEQDQQETQQHLMSCQVITTHPDIKNKVNSIKYNDIYESLDKHIRAIKVFKRILKLRTIKAEEMNQEH